MITEDRDPLLMTEYLRLLGVSAREPNLSALKNLVRAQMMRVPFENISKLKWKHESGGAGIPDLKRYLRGIRDYNFGGTCYTNASHFHSLLAHLGYDVKLCGADMSQPDVHLVNVVRIDNREYLVDVGYAAPFLEPLPFDRDSDF
jgi:arylamine N-acetyltransferase